jgi:hypothetical protein
MTMQIGMVGTDGVLLASDTLWMNTPRFQMAAAPRPRETSNSSKIVIDHKRGIAISYANNMETARRMADEIIAGIGDDLLNGGKSPIGAIVEIGDRILDSTEEVRRDVSGLIAFTIPNPKLFFFGTALINNNPHPRTDCQPVTSKRIAGDNVNAAIFWSERYYERQPIKNLVPLAAHLVVSAGKLKGSAVGGLEIVLCSRDGIAQLPQTTCERLESQANKWDTEIGRLFADYSPDHWEG